MLDSSIPLTGNADVWPHRNTYVANLDQALADKAWSAKKLTVLYKSTCKLTYTNIVSWLSGVLAAAVPVAPGRSCR